MSRSQVALGNALVRKAVLWRYVGWTPKKYEKADPDKGTKCNFGDRESSDMRQATRLVVFALIIAGSSVADWRVECLGDSITQGGRGYTGYRAPLAEAVAEAGWPVEWVGTQSNTYESNPDFPLPHEGRWGWTANRWLYEGSPVLRACSADIVLVLIGTNDCGLETDPALTATRIGQIVERLREGNPRVVVCLGTVLPRRDWANDGLLPARLEALNEGIRGLASLDTPESPVAVVELSEGFTWQQHTWDGLHPNESGEGIIAAHWFDTLSWLPYRLADVYRDGLVNAADVQVTINAVLKHVESVPADVDRDGEATAMDAQRVINAALGMAGF